MPAMTTAIIGTGNIEAAGFDPVKVGGVANAGRIEVPGGDLQGKVLAVDEARVEVPA